LIGRPIDGSGPFSIKNTISLAKQLNIPQQPVEDEKDAENYEEESEDYEEDEDYISSIEPPENTAVLYDEDAGSKEQNIPIDNNKTGDEEKEKQDEITPKEEVDDLLQIDYNYEPEEYKKQIEEEYRVVNTDNDWSMYLSYSPGDESAKYSYVEPSPAQKVEDDETVSRRLKAQRL
jgi:hypothetical protein